MKAIKITFLKELICSSYKTSKQRGAKASIHRIHQAVNKPFTLLWPARPPDSQQQVYKSSEPNDSPSFREKSPHGAVARATVARLVEDHKNSAPVLTSFVLHCEVI